MGLLNNYVSLPEGTSFPSSFASCTCTRGFHIVHQQRAQQERGQHVPWLVLVSPIAGGILHETCFGWYLVRACKGQFHVLSVRPELTKKVIPTYSNSPEKKHMCQYEENPARIPKQQEMQLYAKKIRIVLKKFAINLLLMDTTLTVP